MRMTRPRRLLAQLVDSGQHDHLTVIHAQSLLRDQGIKLPQATVYNVLNEFVRTGLIRRFDLGDRTVYCMAQNNHHHYLDGGSLVDIPGPQPEVINIPTPPLGKSIDRIDIIIRLRDDKA